jgi:hypothetical protein
MVSRGKICGFAILSLAFAWCVPAHPDSSSVAVTDPASGLSVTPPADYSAQLLTPLPSQYSLISVRHHDLGSSGCMIAFHRSDTNGALTQAEFNAQTSKPEWLAKVRAEASILSEIYSIDSIEHGGARGVAITGDRYQHLPASLARLRPPTREWYVVMETTKGRVTLECSSLRDEFETRRAEFEAIIRGISFPQ